MKKLLFLLVLGCLAQAHAQTIAVTMPVITNQNIGTAFNVPVQTSTNILNASNVKAYQFSIALPSNCTFVSIVQNVGDLGQTWGAPVYSVSAGMLTIASAGSTNITGSGTFFRIRLMPAQAGTQTIGFVPTTQCYFNQGTPNRTLTNGSVQVNNPPSIAVDPVQALLVRGETAACSALGGTAPYTFTTLQPAIGSMSASTFTALTQGITNVRATDVNGFSGTSGAFDVRTYGLSAGTASGNASELFDIPITIANPASVGFTAGQLTISFDNSAFDFLGTVTTGHALAGIPITTNVQGDQLSLSFGTTATINPASGTVLFGLRFAKDPSYSGAAVSVVAIVSALFNETLNARTSDGLLQLAAPATISLTPNSVALQAGEQQLFAVQGAGVPPYTWQVTNPMVASISGGGLLTALNGGSTQVTVSDAAGNTATSAPIAIHDADLYLGSSSVLAGTIVHVPVVLGPSVNNEPILSAQLRIAYDPGVLDLLGFTQTATLSQGWSTSYSEPSGEVILSMAGTNAVAPGGVLIHLRFQTLAPFTEGQQTSLSILSGLINEGDPIVETNGGTVTATGNTCGTTGCMNPFACNYDPSALCDDGTCAFDPALCGVRVRPKVFLEGPYVQAQGLMSDALRAAGLVPTSTPYAALGYTHVGGGGGETTSPAVLAATGNDAIVDWVVVELRSSASPATRVATRAALVQRDGDVVSTDGTSALQFNVPLGSYHVAVRHRNHLGAMTQSPVSLSSTAATVDLTSAATATFGTAARKTIGSAQVLWAGDVTFNGNIAYIGSGNDRDPILVTVGNTTPNNIISGTYSTRDVNMNGNVQYIGSGNDRDLILVNVGNTTPNNVRVQQLP